MIRVLVIDDEYLVRERVKRCIDWEQLGFEIAAEAENGQEALALMERIKPRLVVTDISMPYVDGLEFSRALKDRYPQCKIIILTGYGSFDYARAAINIGVCNYLLKPINQDEMLRVVTAIREQIEQEEAIASRLESVRNSEMTLQSLQREKLFSEIISAERAPSASTLSAFSRQFGDLADGPLALFLLEIHYNSSVLDRMGDRDLWRYAVENIFAEVFEPVPNAIINDQEYRLALIVNPTSTFGFSELRALCARAQRFALRHLGISITVGASKEHQGFQRIPAARQEAVEALENRVIWGTGSMIPHEHIQYGLSPLLTSHMFRDTLLINLRLGNFAGITQDLRAFIEDVQTQRRSVETLNLALSDILFSIASFARETEMDIADILTEKSAVDDILKDKENLAQLEASLNELLRRVVQRHSEVHLLGYVGLIGKARRFIDENYTNPDIGLDIIAGNIGVNASHLSSVFKRECGHSIIEYITACRMEKAKTMMDSGACTFVRVSEAVGFNDPYYFSKCFKKFYGVSPSQYMKTKNI